jgi:hypothetical protein
MQGQRPGAVRNTNNVLVWNIEDILLPQAEKLILKAIFNI